MAKFKYTGPPTRARFKGVSFSVGNVTEVTEASAESFRNHHGFEELSAPKVSQQPTKTSKKPAELPEAEKETSKE